MNHEKLLQASEAFLLNGDTPVEQQFYKQNHWLERVLPPRDSYLMVNIWILKISQRKHNSKTKEKDHLKEE